ncbi:2Fe-2S iron-sulfur cluster-binding protein [Zoogloea sp. LCSB751]|uniref:2Fe-2S iron-sulfur cluster-binding protein n=1 Tax=Zoogloea sp. LCSB751 TaxID=1965277 RepID=UPI0009A50AC1|nr:2Fe-2S iron-sulfur cluster-binding protein [Zoogloea sp. LCSB751]
MNAPKPDMRVLTLRLPLLNGSLHAFTLVETRGMTLLRAIRQLRGSLPATRLDNFMCHAGACSTCRVFVDGQPGVPCSTFTRDLGTQISVLPGEHADGWGALRDDSRRLHRG